MGRERCVHSALWRKRRFDEDIGSDASGRRLSSRPRRSQLSASSRRPRERERRTRRWLGCTTKRGTSSSNPASSSALPSKRSVRPPRSPPRVPLNTLRRLLHPHPSFLRLPLQSTLSRLPPHGLHLLHRRDLSHRLAPFALRQATLPFLRRQSLLLHLPLSQYSTAI